MPPRATAIMHGQRGPRWTRPEQVPARRRLTHTGIKRLESSRMRHPERNRGSEAFWSSVQPVMSFCAPRLRCTSRHTLLQTSEATNHHQRPVPAVGILGQLQGGH